jgi:hypothetical protein
VASQAWPQASSRAAFWGLHQTQGSSLHAGAKLIDGTGQATGAYLQDARGADPRPNLFRRNRLAGSRNKGRGLGGAPYITKRSQRAWKKTEIRCA